MISPGGGISLKTLEGRPFESQGRSLLGKEILQTPPGSQELEPLDWSTMGDVFGVLLWLLFLRYFLSSLLSRFSVHLWLNTVYLRLIMT